jgi:hypothetical protein
MSNFGGAHPVVVVTTLLAGYMVSTMLNPAATVAFGGTPEGSSFGSAATKTG